MVRVGLLEQPQVADAINRYFVPIEFDATNGIPADVPAFWFLRKVWKDIPYTRVSFGGEMIMDPEGEVLLSPGYSKHPHNTKNRTVAQMFQQMLRDGLRRHAALQQHEPGTPGREEAKRQIAAKVDGDIKDKRACALDLDFFTACTLDTLGRSDPRMLEEKILGLFTWEETPVRVQLAETLGRYVASKPDEYRESLAGTLLRARVGTLLDDSDPTVRRAAAVAYLEFEGAEAPAAGTEDEALITAARALRDARDG